MDNQGVRGAEDAGFEGGAKARLSVEGGEAGDERAARQRRRLGRFPKLTLTRPPKRLEQTLIQLSALTGQLPEGGSMGRNRASPPVNRAEQSKARKRKPAAAADLENAMLLLDEMPLRLNFSWWQKDGEKR